MARVLLRVTVSVTRAGIRITIELLPLGAGFRAGDAAWGSAPCAVELCTRLMYASVHEFSQPVDTGLAF